VTFHLHHLFSSLARSLLSSSSGEVLAILGPSGAGKTSLLNCLTLEAFGGRVDGDVTLGDEHMNPTLFAAHCTVVTQIDRHWAFLTARETVTYAADFYLNGTSAEKKAAVDEMLEKMGLNGCAETRVGNQFMQGLSGGQKRRLSLAVALIKKPLLVFLDEPTSGLDAAAAANIMEFVKDVAIAENIIIVCTIHQPSSKIFNDFDKVMILSKGRTAFIGPAHEAIPYFARTGHKIPENTNPADFLLDLVNSEFTDPKSVTDILDAWKGGSLVRSASSVNTNGTIADQEKKGDGKISFMHEVTILLRRHGVLCVRDPMVYLGRAIVFIAAMAFFAIIYVKSRDREQGQVINKVFLTMWFFAIPTSLGVIAVYNYNEEFFAIKKEVKNGMIRVGPYLVANFILQIPLMVILSMCALTVSGYGIAGWWSENYVTMIIMYAIVLFAFESLAQLFSVAVVNPLLGMLFFMCIWFMSFLFGGLFVPVEDVIWPFRIFCYILPFFYGLRTMVYLEINDSEYEGAEFCNVGDAGCLFHYDDAGVEIEPGWTCATDGSSSLQCYGRSGGQVMDSIGANYTSMTSEDNVIASCLYILAIGVSFKLLYMLKMYWNCNMASKIHTMRKSK
jgi:ABC-type multidrug transport system ATPase subunit